MTKNKEISLKFDNRYIKMCCMLHLLILLWEYLLGLELNKVDDDIIRSEGTVIVRRNMTSEELSISHMPEEMSDTSKWFLKALDQVRLPDSASQFARQVTSVHMIGTSTEKIVI